MENIKETMSIISSELKPRYQALADKIDKLIEDEDSKLPNGVKSIPITGYGLIKDQSKHPKGKHMGFYFLFNGVEFKG